MTAPQLTPTEIARVAAFDAADYPAEVAAELLNPTHHTTEPPPLCNHPRNRGRFTIYCQRPAGHPEQLGHGNAAGDAW